MCARGDAIASQAEFYGTAAEKMHEWASKKARIASKQIVLWEVISTSSSTFSIRKYCLLTLERKIVALVDSSDAFDRILGRYLTIHLKKIQEAYNFF